VICPLCEQDDPNLAADEICLNCIAKYWEDFPHEQEEIICVDYDASVAAESDEPLPE
jgi:hypothetical protein